MDKYHHTSGIKVKSLEKAPNEICAAAFVNKDSGMQHVIKIEGRIMAFSPDSLRMYVAVIQSDSIIKAVEILPEQVKKKAFTLFPENLYIAPGNFYVGYIYKFAHPCDVFYLTNKNFPNHIFSLQQDAPETFSIAGDAPDIYQMFYRTPQLRIVAK